MDAILKIGEPLMVPHTPGSAQNGGDVVVIDGDAAVFHSDAEASKVTSVALKGGVYLMTADGAIANRTKVFWDGTSKISATGSDVFGKTLEAASGDGDKILVYHDPDTP